MTAFEDIGWLLMDVAKTCGVDAARIVTGDGIQDQSGFYVVGSEPFQAPDGTKARLILLNRQPRQMTDREIFALKALALHAQMQLT